MNDYYPLIARAVERLDRSTGEARRAVYERARIAVAQLRSNQPALLDADITKERLALEEAIRKVEAEAARKSPPETRAEPRSAAPSEGMPDGDKIQSRDHLQPASPARDDRPPALSSRQAPKFLPTASDDHHPGRRDWRSLRRRSLLRISRRSHLFGAGSLRPAGGDPPSLVAGEQLGRRASSRLFLEIDVGQRLAVVIPASLMRLFQMHHLARLSCGLFRLV